MNIKRGAQLMKMYFKLEFKKALFSKKTLLSIAIILAVFIFPNLKEIMYPVPQLDGVDNFIRFYSLSYIGVYGFIQRLLLRIKSQGFWKSY